MHISLEAETLGYILGFPITNSLVLALVTALILVGSGFFVARSLKVIPARMQSIIEVIIESILDFMTQILQDRKQALKFFPLVATIFLFILINNWIGVLPGVGSLGFFEEEIFWEEVFLYKILFNGS